MHTTFEEKGEEHRLIFVFCFLLILKGNSAYSIPIVVPTGVVNDTKWEMSLPSVLVAFDF